ncbi:electron transporter [Bryobacterales bacterium F-183]|nr:electron transporter [Bryobacterales bacterium F-183]
MSLLWVALLAFFAPQKHRVEALVLEVDRAQGVMLVSHREIPGVMPAMVMPFHVRPASQLDTLRPGSRITFDFRTGSSQATGIQLLDLAAPTTDFVMPKATNALRIGDLVPDFQLTDHTGQTVRLSDIRKPTLISFIYTRCPLPEVCPRLAANSAYLHRRFGDRLQILTITLDPTYDTVPVLNNYANRWRADGKHWRFLTGDERSIQKVAEHFGIVFWPEEGAITHTSATAIIDPDRKLRAVVTGLSYRPEQLRDLVEKHLR